MTDEFDINPAVVDRARERAARAGLTNVSFLDGDLADLRLDHPSWPLPGLESPSERETSAVAPLGGYRRTRRLPYQW